VKYGNQKVQKKAMKKEERRKYKKRKKRMEGSWSENKEGTKDKVKDNRK
jgi:hypothetical protein